MATPHWPDRMSAWQGWLSPSAPWLYLAYLGFFFTGWFYRTPPPVEIALSLSAMALFIAVYGVAMQRRDWTVIPAVLVCAALGLAFLTVNPGGGVFLVYAGTILARAHNRILRIGGLALLPLVIIAAGLALNYAPLFILAALAVTAMAVSGSAYALRREQREAELEDHRAAAESRAAEAERQRIARDLHDLLGQSLTLITLKAELAARTLGDDPAKARGELDEIAEVSRKALVEMRAAVSGLRALSLDSAARQARRLLADAGLSVAGEAAPVTLGGDREAALVLALREGTTNILRHARASAVRLDLEQSGNEVRLELSDDGCGGAHAGGGLNGVADRLLACGGRLDIADGPDGRGTRMTAVVPVGGE